MKYKKVSSLHGVPRSDTSCLRQIFNSSPNVRFKYQPLYSYIFKDKINLNSKEEEIRIYFYSLYDYESTFLDQKVKIDKTIYPEFIIKNKQPASLVSKMDR